MATTTIAQEFKENRGPEDSVAVAPLNKSLFGLLMFIGTEVMFFGGLISSFIILRAGAAVWPPIDQPRLPIAITGVNTLILLISGFTIHRALAAIRRGEGSGLIRWLSVTVLLGTIFLFVQGTEWVRLLRYGLTFTSSIYGGAFYTLIGCHGLHVLAGLTAMIIALRNSLVPKYTASENTGVMLCGVYWYFVVGIWPVLYILVYLN